MAAVKTNAGVRFTSLKQGNLVSKGSEIIEVKNTEETSEHRDNEEAV